MKLDKQNAYNSLSFMAEALIPLIDELKDTNQPKHQLKRHINGMLRELEKLSITKYKVFKDADKIEDAKRQAIKLLKQDTKQEYIRSIITDNYGHNISKIIMEFLSKNIKIRDSVDENGTKHSYEDLMIVTDNAYARLADIISRSKANEIVSLITVYDAFTTNPEVSLSDVITNYKPLKK